MELPDEVCFRSAQEFWGDGSDDNSVGFHVQYQIHEIMVNVVIMSSIDPDSPEANVEDLLLDKLGDGSEHADLAELERSDRINGEIESWMENACKSTLLEIAATTKPREETLTLHNFVHPETINLQLKTIDEKVTVLRFDGSPPWPTMVNLGYPWGEKATLQESNKFPSYLSHQIEMVEPRAVAKVSVDGHTFRCKLNSCEEVAKREHEVYLKLSALNLESVRIPAFKGYVKEQTGGDVIGLLLEDINARHSTLPHAMGERPYYPSDTKPEVAKLERRQKWAKQIAESVRLLHDHSIVWGDVKPENVLIDVDDNAWILDFGGGFSLPFKLPNEVETMEGDDKAVKLLVQYLETGEVPPMPEGHLLVFDQGPTDHVQDHSPQSASEDSGDLEGEHKSHRKRKRSSLDEGKPREEDD